MLRCCFAHKAGRGRGGGIQYAPHGDANEPKIIKKQDFEVNLRGCLEVVSTGL